LPNEPIPLRGERAVNDAFDFSDQVREVGSHERRDSGSKGA